MPAKKKPVQLTQEELFPHGGFPYRLEYKDENNLTRLCWFQCEHHLTKHVARYKIAQGQTHVAEGSEALSVDPFQTKPKRTRKTAAKKPSATKASKKTTTKKPAKPAAKTTRTKSTAKTAKKKVFSNLDTFFES